MKSDILAYFLTPIGQVWANWLLFLISLYVVFEVIDVATRMHSGDRLCRLAKYLTTCVSGVLGIVFSLSNLAMPLMLIFMLSLALFLWPTMVYRIRGEHRNRINDR